MGVARKIAAEMILPIKAFSSSFLSIGMLSKYPMMAHEKHQRLGSSDAP